jgi:hypothetical protein
MKRRLRMKRKTKMKSHLIHRKKKLTPLLNVLYIVVQVCLLELMPRMNFVKHCSQKYKGLQINLLKVELNLLKIILNLEEVYAIA